LFSRVTERLPFTAVQAKRRNGTVRFPEEKSDTTSSTQVEVGTPVFDHLHDLHILDFQFGVEFDLR